ncbi:TRAFAC clade GTPase domain-containing protein [Siphonobacter sp.]|uniref:TRAFAC clade GTPase domain-containing protein n=1 Tax=Siphonobacter sp. TaxID=1869184 RepID=UPI003B3A4EB7
MHSTFTITMLAPSGEGKTTYLSSLVDAVQKDFLTNIPLEFNLDAEAEQALNQEKQKLVTTLSKGTIGYRDGIQSTAEVGEYTLDIAHPSDDPFLTLRFVDLPGEWLQENPDRVSAYVDLSTAIFIPVDAASLMNDIRGNHDQQAILSILSQAFADLTEPRLVVFIPTKAETYVGTREGAQQVMEKISEVYAAIIDFLTQQSLVRVAIIPIETLGSSQLMYFTRGGSNQLLQPVFSVTERHRFNPRNTEYPLVYLLSFIFELYYLRRSYGVMGFFRNLFRGVHYLKTYSRQLGQPFATLPEFKVINEGFMQIQKH